MAQTDIVYPVLVQVLLTLVILLRMGLARGRSLSAQRKSMQDVALNRTDDWDETATKLSNNFRNQFEVPVLFYVASLLALQLTFVNYLMLVFAWVFVLSRIAHAVIHTGANIVATRFSAFAIGVFAVAGMWVIIAIRLLVAVP